MYQGPQNIKHKTYKPKLKGDIEKIKAAVELMSKAKRPLFYTGGEIGRASCRERVSLTV